MSDEPLLIPVPAGTIVSGTKSLDEFRGRGITADLERRVEALESKLANADGVTIDFRAASLEPLLDRIAALEATIEGGMKMWKAVAKGHSDLAEDFDKLEAALAKQRVVNEAFLTALIELMEGVPEDRETYKKHNRIFAALRDALK
jgi:hypothetical protein